MTAKNKIDEAVKRRTSEAGDILKLAKADYQFDEDVFCEDSEKVRILKYILDHKLGVVDRRIMILYFETESYRELGRLLHVSKDTMFKEVRRIRQTIINEYYNIKNKQ